MLRHSTCSQELSSMDKITTVCLACGVALKKKQKRPLSNVEAKHILDFVRRIYITVLQEKGEVLGIDCIINSEEQKQGYVCTNCYKTLSTHIQKEEGIKSNVAKMTSVLPTVSSEESHTLQAAGSSDALICSPQTASNIETPSGRKRKTTSHSSVPNKRKRPDVKVIYCYI